MRFRGCAVPLSDEISPALMLGSCGTRSWAVGTSLRNVPGASCRPGGFVTPVRWSCFTGNTRLRFPDGHYIRWGSVCGAQSACAGTVWAGCSAARLCLQLCFAASERMQPSLPHWWGVCRRRDAAHLGSRRARMPIERRYPHDDCRLWPPELPARRFTGNSLTRDVRVGESPVESGGVRGTARGDALLTVATSGPSRSGGCRRGGCLWCGLSQLCRVEPLT